VVNELKAIQTWMNYEIFIITTYEIFGDQSMNIAYVYDAIYPWIKGGAEKRIYELSKRLVQRGHHIHIFGVKWWDGADVINRDGVILHGVCKPMELYINGKRSIKEALVFSYKLLPHLLSMKFDIIDCNQFPYFSCFTAKIASIKYNCPLVVGSNMRGKYPKG